jgi:hypothetical protein
METVLGIFSRLAFPGIIRGGAICFLFLHVLSGPLRGENLPPGEYQVKAAFLSKFIKYVSWNGSRRLDGQDEVVIGVLGETPLWEKLTPYEGTVVGSHRLRIVRLAGSEEIRTCRLLFIGSVEKRELGPILESAGRFGVVTISDRRRFIQEGGMIGFIPRGRSIHFDINNRVARAAGVQISSHLLRLAATVLD